MGAGGNERLIERLQDQTTREEVRIGIVDRILHDRGGGDPKHVFISSCTWDTSLEGKNLAEITADRGMEPTSDNAAVVVMDLITSGGACAVYHAMSEEDVERIMQHPATAIGSDGPLSVFGEGTPHPRHYGTFARVLGYYVREEGILRLEEAVRKMTSATAQRLGLQDRGLLRERYLADVAIFDPDEIRDTATFEDPHQYPVDVRFVIVNGVTVVAEGRHSGLRPGRAIHGPGFSGN